MLGFIHRTILYCLWERKGEKNNENKMGQKNVSSINCYNDVISCSGVLQLNNINFFETLDIALFFCQFFCIFYSYFLVLCDIIVSGGVSYG